MIQVKTSSSQLCLFLAFNAIAFGGYIDFTLVQFIHQRNNLVIVSFLPLALHFWKLQLSEAFIEALLNHEFNQFKPN